MRRPPSSYKCFFAAYFYRHNRRVLKNAISGTLFFLFFLLSFGNGLFAQNPAIQVPSYEWVDKKDLPTVSLSLSGLNSEDVTIAIATDREDNVYTLTFGSGVIKRDSNGNVIDANFITGLSSPLDIAVDKDGLIYIADYFAGGETFEDNGQIKIFDQQGNYIRSILTSFYRPMGIDVDEQNVYIAEYNSGEKGPETNELSRIRVVDKVTNVVRSTNNNVEIPYRIAVNSEGRVFVSQAGDNDSAVLIFDKNLNYESQLSKVQSPGSIVIDEFDYIHVVEFAERVNFSDFVNFEELGISDAQDIAEDIDNGVEDNAFGIKIFSPSLQLEDFFKSKIQFPVDIAFSDCDKMYVNNAYVIGKSYFLIGYIPEKIQFDLEINERTPTFDSLEGPEIACANDIVVTAEPGDDFAIVEFAVATATDNCSATVLQTKGDSSGSEFTVGTHSIEFTATDDFGQTDTCTFTITVEASEEPDPLEISCTGTQTEDMGGDCTFTIPDYTGMATVNNSAATITQTPLKGAEVSENTTVRLTATLEGESVSCDFEVVLNNYPELSISCPADKTENANPEGLFSLPDYTDEAVVSGNCSTFTVTQTPAPGTEIEKDTEITFMVTDADGNKKYCTFDVQFIQPEEPDPLEISCPGTQTEDMGGDCTFTIPDYTGMATVNNSAATITQTPLKGAEVSENTTVRLTATLEGETVSCDFEVVLNNHPELSISCPADKTENANSEGLFSLPDYTDEAVVSGNCSTFTVTQNPVPGTEIEEDTEITFMVTDADGNKEYCKFNVQLIQPEEPDPLEISCPGTQTEDMGGDCTFTIPDYTGMATANNSAATITQTPLKGAEVSENMTVRLTATLEGETDSCEFEVVLNNQPKLSISCPADKSENANSEGLFSLPDYTDEAVVSGNCSTFTVTQNPVPGTEIEEDTEITFMVTDADGNKEYCTFNVQLIQPEEPDPLKITCLENRTEGLTESCVFVVPDYRRNVQTNNPEAQVIQLPAPGTMISESTEVKLTASLGEENATCTFQLDLKDNISPVANCISDFTLHLNEQGVGTLSPTIIDDGSTDNCGIAEMTLSKTNFTTGDIGEQDITFTVFDAAGNVDTCITSITVEPYDEEDEDGQVSCPDSLELALDENGEATLTLNYTGNDENEELEVSKSYFTCNDIGTETVTARFWGEYTGSCEIEVTVVDNLPPQVSCISDYDLKLGEDGTAAISVEDLEISASDNCGVDNISLSRNNFTSEDIGEQEVVISVTDNSGNVSTCTTTVNVISDEIPAPELECVGTIVLELNENGEAFLSPEEVYNSNGTVPQDMQLSQARFTCEDIGATEVVLTATYSGGSTQSCLVLVNLTDPEEYCSTTPVDPAEPERSPYVIIYPNPGRGVVYVETSEDIQLQRAEVFDMRGRFLMAARFDVSAGEMEDYSLDLRKFQSGVYTIIYYSEDDKFIRRAVISLN
ncbi:HYR domain-containing protein [Salinimicrobium sp. GXAS 041]|uniref:HYR domain-containing protein n=1 Tax=Salinimicrobium sp. GXAS 041 TaxID=3400806 RepID=UPI003C7877F9